MRPFVSTTQLAILIAFLAKGTFGLELNVPAEFPTIQSAFNATTVGDTVRIAPGIYHEFLTCSTDSLHITGWYSADTLSELRTLFDPVPGGVDTPSAMVLTGNIVTIRNLAFFNREEMRQQVWPTRKGGVHHTGNKLTIQDCRFDSVSYAVHSNEYIEANGCNFVGCLWHCLFPTSEGTVKAVNCTFEGSKRWLVYGASGSRILNCTFRRENAPGTYLLRLHGNDVEVRGCHFSADGGAFTLISIYPQGDFLIEECVFENITGGRAIIEVSLDCLGAEVDTPIVIRENVFRNYEGNEFGGTTAILLGCQNPNPGYFGLIENNTFEDGYQVQGNPGVSISGSVTLMDNSFEQLGPTDVADVMALRGSQDTILARNNSFLTAGLSAGSNGCYFDARENWWDDSTGPFHANLNPNGLGTDVGNNVVFEPWLVQHPDSVDSTNAIDQNLVLGIATDFSLTVFPNPFNPTATMSFMLPNAGAAVLTVHDILGREVARHELGFLVAGEHRVRLDGAMWGSGLHFATVSTKHGSRTVKVLLLK